VALSDPDARVRAAALDAWSAARPKPDTALSAVARAHVADADPWIRAAAIDALRGTATRDDLAALIAAWQQSANDPTSDARLAVIRTLGALARRENGLLTDMVQAGGSGLLQRPADPVVRADAIRSWPELAARWGDKWPIETNRTLEDYRTVVRKYMLADSNPHVTIEVQGKGTIDVELLGREAPLTVANFLTLVDRHYFDGDRWHRVVPNFVIQDGDPTGTGNGGPGWSIRDEINRERYALPVLGMALDGPDTGGSQWFFNLAEVPQLDGVYTIFGRIPSNYSTLGKILQGDVIRSIHR
jgi:cyclophilin family peptidyl-prolyl cis-trans isomerase